MTQDRSSSSNEHEGFSDEYVIRLARQAATDATQFCPQYKEKHLCWMLADRIERLSALQSETTDRTLRAIDDEPEVPGHMPDEMWAAINGDRDACEQAIRIAVRQTKDGIRERYLKGAK